ncbi:hypothetical protein HDU80_003812, partial [Chytriomyces hyalinus]
MKPAPPNRPFTCPKGSVKPEIPFYDCRFSDFDLLELKNARVPMDEAHFLPGDILLVSASIKIEKTQSSTIVEFSFVPVYAVLLFRPEGKQENTVSLYSKSALIVKENDWQSPAEGIEGTEGFAQHDFEGIVKGSARQPRSAKTPPSELGDNHNEGNDHEERNDHKDGEDDEERHDNQEGDDFEEGHDHDEEADNAETELATSDVEEEQLGAPLTGGPLKP